METYDFISKKITEQQVRQIISESGYDANSFTYAPRVDRDGFVARGATRMSLTTLRNTARRLNITVEISSPNLAGVATTRLDADDRLGATSYGVSITIDPVTLGKLQSGLYSLYAFKAVKATQGGGSPVVWFKADTQSLLPTTSVDWEEQYQAYTSNSQIIPGGKITTSFAADIDLGQTLDASSVGGDVVSGGTKGAISIYNTTTQQFTCGISEIVAGVAKPLCAFPLYGEQLDVMAPIQKVLLMFATKQVDTGTVIERAYSGGLMINLTGTTQRDVSFDINQGWSWGGGAWGTKVKANEDLVPLLIETPNLAAFFAVESES